MCSYVRAYFREKDVRGQLSPAFAAAGCHKLGVNRILDYNTKTDVSPEKKFRKT